MLNSAGNIVTNFSILCVRFVVVTAKSLEVLLHHVTIKQTNKQQKKGKNHSRFCHPQSHFIIHRRCSANPSLGVIQISIQMFTLKSLTSNVLTLVLNIIYINICEVRRHFMQLDNTQFHFDLVPITQQYNAM